MNIAHQSEGDRLELPRHNTIPCPVCGKPRFARKDISPEKPCAKCNQTSEDGKRQDAARHRARYWQGRSPTTAPHGWKGVDAKPHAKRCRTHRRYAVGKCEICGMDGKDRHHMNGNLDDMSPSNIKVLCRRCHMTIDGRLERARNSPSLDIGRKKRTPHINCVICGEYEKYLRKGRCQRCDSYFRKTGTERPLNISTKRGKEKK